MIGVSGSFSSSLSPPCFCATSTALSESTLRNWILNTCVLELPGLYVSSTPGETSPFDHVYGLAPCCAGEANLARQVTDLPSCPLESLDGCESMRYGCASCAQPRAAM